MSIKCWGLLIVVSQTIAFAVEGEISTFEYIDYWKVTAIEQMDLHKIPASITLAQGILESASGNSKLAREAKNHFGIKCHKGWNGSTFIQDDDKKDECFRSYVTASASYNDHSLFLTTRERYSKLFQLRLTDYKGWAKGLKAAGYATNPKYADLLINLIEKNNLQQYDLMQGRSLRIKEEEFTATHRLPKDKEIFKKGLVEKSALDLEQKDGHKVFEHKNGTKYVVVGKGDTFYQIASEFEMGLWQLYKYNDLGQRDVLKEGEFVYLVPKRNKARRSFDRLETNTRISYRSISQLEGIKLKKLMKLNGANDPDAKLPIGTKIILR